LDHVIAIVRESDRPRDELINQFGLTENQANAVLDMRLRSLRRLEEIALRTERDKLVTEQTGLRELLVSEISQWAAIADQIKDIRAFFAKTDRRMTVLSDPPQIDFNPTDILVEREPITVICSKKGWIRAMRGHQDLNIEFKYKEGDGVGFVLHAETTDKILLFAENGRFYTLAADKLPRGRGFGEPVSLIVDLPSDISIVNLLVVMPGKMLVAASSGHGLVVDIFAAVAQTRSGKQILNVAGNSRAVACCMVKGDMVASIGVNRKLIVFPLHEVPEMNRGKGVILQRFKDGGLADIAVFDSANGLSWQTGGRRVRKESDLTKWIARRGGSGKLPPSGFPRPARFN
jgi:topoisomerase-4 subunit A